MAVIPKILSGGLDLKSSISTIGKSNYLNAVDVTDKSTFDENENNVWQLNNNADYAFDVGAIVEQPKIYSLSIDFAVDVDGLSTPFGTNIVLVIEKAGAYKELLVLNDGNHGLTPSQWQTNIIAALTTSNPLLQTQILANDLIGNTLTIVFQCNCFGNSDWIFQSYMELSQYGEFNYSTLWSVTVEVVQDAFSAEKVGSLTPIMMSNKGNEVIVYSTTGKKEIETIRNIEAFPNTVPLHGDCLCFEYDPRFEDGEDVFIYYEDELLTGFNGNFTLHKFEYVPTIFEFALLGTQNPITGFILDPRPPAYITIVKNKNTASTIGIARKNENTNAWTYTELVRSNKLNFRTYKQIRDAIITSTDLGVNNDWTDGLNPIRRLLYKGDWTANGYLSYYNPKALYNLDTIAEESKLQIGQNTSKISLAVNKTGGAKPEATYIAFVRFGSKDDGVQTGWSHYSNHVWTHSQVLSVHQYNNATEMALSIHLEQIPLNQFSTAQIGIVEFSANAFTSYILPEVDVKGLTEVTVIDIGDKSKYLTWDAKNEVEVPLVVFDSANNLLDFDNYIVTADVDLALPYDLSDWAKTIVLNTQIRQMQITNDFASFQQSGGWLSNGYNNTEYMSNEWMSCMPSEWHRIAVAVDWKNGSPTTYFWIKDIYIDPTLTDYQITDDTIETVNVYQYFIEASQINMNYLLPDGQLVRDVVKDIRFARTKVFQEVLATGLAITSYPAFVDGQRVLTPQYIASNSINPSLNDGSVLALYSPDLINNGKTISFKASDRLIGIASSIQKIKVFSPALGLVAIDYFGDKYYSDVIDYTVNDIQTLTTGQTGEYLNLGNVKSWVTSNPSLNFLGCVSIVPTTPFPDNAFFSSYYKRPAEKVDPVTNSPYITDPLKDNFYIVPQSTWYDEATHNTNDTVYGIYSGDCFPQKQYCRISNDTWGVIADKWTNLVGFYSYNRTNGAMRSGTPTGYGFPQQSVYNVLTQNTLSDDYIFDSTFTPKHLFQNRLPFNPKDLYVDKTIATIYYSGKRLNGALYGNNRIWMFNDNGVLENVYGRVTDLSILLGTSGNNAIFVKQERNTTMQFFDNTARLITTSVEAILGTGGILDTKGTFLTVSGSSHKFAKAKCLSPTSNKEFDIWFDVNTRTFNRFGADGSRIISESITPFLQKYTTLANLDSFNNADRPVHDYGILARWDNKKKEYVCTFRLIAKNRDYEIGVPNVVGDILNGGTTFGFESLPKLYKCIQANTNESLTNPLYFTEYADYIDDLHQCYTLVWNEIDNAWKGFYSFLPHLYGNTANNFLSSNPSNPSLIYEHNYDNQARYYCSVPELVGSNGSTISFTSEGYVVNGNDDAYGDYFGIVSYPFTPTLDSHTSYYFYNLNTKKYHRIIKFLANDLIVLDINEDIDSSQLYPTQLLSYGSTCNAGQPLIEGVFNDGYPRYFSFGDIQLNIDLPPSRVETVGGLDSLGQKTTQSYMEYSDFEYAQGQARVASGMDITNGGTNKRGFQGIEGYWIKLKTFFQPNIKNKMLDQQIVVTEQNKRRK